MNPIQLLMITVVEGDIQGKSLMIRIRYFNS